MPSAEIITIGTEILLGEIVDTNTRHIARTLRDLGIDLYRTVTIGDNVGRIADAIRHSMDRAEIVITTGGLGPTVDDPTREAVARAAGRPLEFREDLWQDVRATIARYGRRPTENQRRQAHVPEGSLVIRNPVGTAPAFIVETGPGALIALPGVPGEMELLLHESVVPYLQRRFELRNVIKVRLLHTAGQGEGAIDEQIGDLETLTNPTVGLAAHNGVVDIRVAAKAGTEAEAEKMIANIETEVRSRLGDIVFGVDEDNLHAVTLAAVGVRSWALTIATFGIPETLLSGMAPIVSLQDLRMGSLAERLGAMKHEIGSAALLGVAAYESEMALEIAVLTPAGENNVRFTYGGHPRNLPRWALNTGLNMLRLLAQTTR
jgi:competence/damage-inducible protein CinA-like protein